MGLENLFAKDKNMNNHNNYQESRQYLHQN